MTIAALDHLLASLTSKALNQQPLARTELLAVLETGEDELMEVIAAASRIRRRFFDRRVKLNYLVNMKSGMCPEDCNYCSQRLGSTAEIMKYSWISSDQASAQARAAIDAGRQAGLSGRLRARSGVTGTSTGSPAPWR